MQTKSDLELSAQSTAASGRVGAGQRPSARPPEAMVIPWQERPSGSRDVVWRHAGNPIIGRNFMPGVQGIYNSAVAPFGDGFVGVFRVEKGCRFPHLHVGWSEDGLVWLIEPEPIEFAGGEAGTGFKTASEEGQAHFAPRTGSSFKTAGEGGQAQFAPRTTQNEPDPGRASGGGQAQFAPKTTQNEPDPGRVASQGGQAQFAPRTTQIEPDPGCIDYAYDPRVCQIDGTYYISWCCGQNGPTIGLASTSDFQSFQRLENAFLPFNRNGVLFPRKIGGKYFMLSRPSDDGHTPFGDIYLSQSPDLVHWGMHRLVMRAGGGEVGQWWQRTKIGAGPVPIETQDGWLAIYHGVIDTCNGFVYSMGAALLDLDEPWRVRYRTNQHILTPEQPYEVSGHVPNVVFPCAALHDEKSNRLAVYYGAADTSCCVAYAHLDELIAFIKENSCVF